MNPHFLAPAFLLALAVGPALALQKSGQTTPEPLHEVEGLREYRLENGLRVVLFPDPSRETFTVNVTVLVGSRHEGLGEKGMAHLLEHMLFKGTDTFANIWGVLEDHGADFNGSTWVDRTNYYETLPAGDENLEFALHLEADRLTHSRIAAEDLAKEFSVVRNEFEMGENSPVEVLTERITSAAYLWHNYGFSTIGNRSDIERVPVENLRRFYRRYYRPDNALLVVAGRFQDARALELVQQHFGAIPRPVDPLEQTYTSEPPQDGARLVSLERVGGIRACGVAYHVPAGSHPDSAALALLTEILVDEPSGRAYQALVPAGLATQVSGFSFPTAEPGLLMLLAESRADQDGDQALATLTDVVEGMAHSVITAEEVERARTKLLKEIKLALAESGRIGVELSEWQALGDWRMFFVHRDRLKEVTADDVKRVAQHYLLASNRTAGIFRPVESGKEPERAVIPETPDVDELVASYTGSETIAAGEAFDPTPDNIEQRTQRAELAPGIKLALLPKETRGDQVVVRLRLHYGDEAALRTKKAALSFLPALLRRGTEHLDYQALQDQIDRLQARIDVSGEPGALDGSVVTDRAHLGQALALLCEILRRPGFAADQFELVKKERLAALENGLTDPMARAFNEISRLFAPFPPESFHYVPTLEEEIALTQAVTLEELRTAHAAFLGASHAELSVVGDFDPGELKQTLAKTLGDWKSPAPYQRIVRPFAATAARNATIDTPDKEMAVVATGTSLKLRDDHPDYPALEFANYVLGQSAKSRLMNRLRHEGGLSYGAGSRLQTSAQDEAAALSGFAICAPQNARAAQEALREEFKKWIEAGVTAEELADGKKGFELGFENRLADDDYVAGQLLEDLETDRSFSFHGEILKRIDSLSLQDIQTRLQQHFSQAQLFEVLAGDLKKAESGE